MHVYLFNVLLALIVMSVGSLLSAMRCMAIFIYLFNIHVLQRMNPKDFGDALSFPLVPLLGWIFVFQVKMS